MGERDFTWRDGERTVIFRDGLIEASGPVLVEQGWERFELLTTPRAVASAPVDLVEAAGAVHYVSQGGVPEVAAEVMGVVRGAELVALGGGRVIDVAKAIAAVRQGHVAAIPTTLSGAPMTGFHRLPAGHEGVALVRPALVLADPDLMTALDDVRLRGTALNALAHGADSLYTPLANPVSKMAALRGAELIGGALAKAPASRDRAELALGSLLCGFAVGSALFALHHVVSQSVVRVLGTPHAETHATMLPHTMAAMRDRAPDAIGELAAALGSKPPYLARRIEKLGGGPRRLSALNADRDQMGSVIDTIMARPELAWTPSPPGREEIAALVEKAW